MDEEIDIEEAAPWIVLFLTLTGGWLRILFLGKQGLWLDEAFSLWLANHNMVELLHWTVRIDQHPPLYYLLLHGWLGFYSDTPYNARLLSALFGTLTIPVIYQIGKRLSGALVGVAAALFLALSPFNLRFAQEARMYTLLTFNAAVAIYALVRLLTDPRATQPIGSQLRAYWQAWRKPQLAEPDAAREFSYQLDPSRQTGWRAWVSPQRWQSVQAIETDLAWAGLVIFSAATLLSHNTAVFFILATNLFVLGLILFQNRSENQPAFLAPSLLNWIKAQLGIFLLWSPWLWAFIQQARRVDQEFWIPQPTWESVVQALKTFLNAATPAPGQSNPVMPLWILYGLALGLGLIYYRKEVSRFFFLATLFVVPFLGELLVSLRRPIFYDRTLIWITIPLFLALAAGIAQLRFRLLIVVALGVFGANNLFSAGDYYRWTQKEDWGTAAGYVANYAEKEDLILFNATWVQIPFDYYFKEYEELYLISVERRGVPQDLFEADILEPKMTNGDVPRLLALLNGRKRVWLVYSHNWYTDPQGLIPQTLGSRMKLAQQRDFYGGQVLLYETP
jgi:uncharacterized membrane protein